MGRRVADKVKALAIASGTPVSGAIGWGGPGGGVYGAVGGWGAFFSTSPWGGGPCMMPGSTGGTLVGPLGIMPVLAGGMPCGGGAGSRSKALFATRAPPFCVAAPGGCGDQKAFGSSAEIIITRLGD